LICWEYVGNENKKTSEYQRFMFLKVVLQGQEPT
jgi:hypothetical protein